MGLQQGKVQALKVSKVNLATASVMHRVDIRPSQIHEYMVQRSGGYSEVGYMRRDVENVVAKTEQAYMWLLVTFLDAIEGKHPKSILTDGDKAMHKVISTTLPQSIHRLCCWHLERNAQTNVGRTEFTADFKDCMLYTKDHQDFQDKWDAMVRKHQVKSNEWVKKMKLQLIEFVDQIDRLMNKQREIEGKDDFDSSYGSPILCTHLRQYEQQTGEIYMKSMFEKVRAELNKEGLLFIKGYIDDISTQTYSIEEFRKANKEWKVVFHHQTKLAACQCQLLESLGISCSHSYTVLKAEDVQSIPECMQLMRWLKIAKINNPPQNDDQTEKVYMSNLVRIGSVNAACKSLQYLTSQSLEAYKEAMEGIHSLTLRLQSMSLTTTEQDFERNPDVIRDPMLVLTKGALKQSKKVLQTFMLGVRWLDALRFAEIFF
ncbi:protein FAR1-RELATED SEQUENCE 5-like [Citrus clementina]|uniref:protein FAR1-RELATED SEQUENCE 5-like n=1 Tax=Citrus clementina TaxID=85681 RepID=UPI0007637FFA|nr:protein FAR1-RELATED SEQUENCE 5-like [Citrus x clementina]